MEEMKSSSTIRVIGKILAAAIPILAIALPVAGFSFNLGYISVFGIDYDAFPRPVFEFWQYSYVISMFWLSEVLKTYSFLLRPIIYFLIVISMSGIALVVLRTNGVLPLSKKRYKEKLGKVDRFIESFDLVFDEIKSLLYWLAMITAVILSVYLLLADSYKRGRDFAQKALNYYNLSGCTANTKNGWASCVSYSNPSNPERLYRGLLVAASSTHIAIFDGNGINVIPRNAEYVLTRAYKAGIGNDIKGDLEN